MTVSSYYAWGAEWMPLSVLLSSHFIDQMNEAITQSLAGQTGRVEEVGGILLGTVERRPLAAPVVRIEGFEPVLSEHRRGPSYSLSAQEKTALARKLDRWNRQGKNLQPVGFYRTHTRRGLYLDNDDFSVLQSYFAEPESVFLLVRLLPDAARVAGCFFWDGGDIQRQSSFQEFPFDTDRLKLIQPPPQPATRLAERVARATPRPKPGTAAGILANRMETGIALAVVLFSALAFYAVRPLLRPHRAAAIAAPARVAPLAVLQQPSPPIEKPSPSKTAPAPRPRVQPAPAAVVSGTAARADTKRVAPAPEPPKPVVIDVAPAQLAEAAPPLPAPPPPPPAEPPVAIPSRTVANPPATTVTVEPVRESKVGRLVGHIPGLRRLEKKNQNFVPARPIREIAPATPASEQLEHDVPVDLRVRIDPSGRVASIEPASKAGNPRLADLAADAARNWQFEPARRNDEQVSSELILHFTFRSTVRSAP